MNLAWLSSMLLNASSRTTRLMNIRSICSFMDGIFDDCRFPNDPSNNGLQVEASAECTRIAFAVDACTETIAAAADAGAQLLVVHHGLSWGNGFQRVRGVSALRFSEMFRRGVSLYAMHLPLDGHPLIGNNSVLARILGLEVTDRFIPYGNLNLGTICDLPVPRPLEGIVADVMANLNPSPRVFDFSNGLIRRIAIITGSGGSCISQCIEKGADCFITGEIRHENFHEAQEGNLSIITAGHYVTEDTGIRELMKLVRAELGIETVFIESPTGL